MRENMCFNCFKSNFGSGVEQKMKNFSLKSLLNGTTFYPINFDLWKFESEPGTGLWWNLRERLIRLWANECLLIKNMTFIIYLGALGGLAMRQRPFTAINLHKKLQFSSVVEGKKPSLRFCQDSGNWRLMTFLTRSGLNFKRILKLPVENLLRRPTSELFNFLETYLDREISRRKNPEWFLDNPKLIQNFFKCQWRLKTFPFFFITPQKS